jgi:hypothetical protein
MQATYESRKKDVNLNYQITRGQGQFRGYTYAQNPKTKDSWLCVSRYNDARIRHKRDFRLYESQ